MATAIARQCRSSSSSKLLAVGKEKIKPPRSSESLKQRLTGSKESGITVIAQKNGEEKNAGEKEKLPRLVPLTELDGVLATDRLMPFGEYKGRSMGSLASGYLGWLADNLKYREGIKHEVARLAEGVLSLRREYNIAQARFKYRIIHAVDRTLKRTSAVKALQEVDRQNVSDPDLVYGSLLRRCCQYKSLEEGRLVHEHIVKNGLMHNRYLCNLVVQMYAKCGKFMEARSVFDSIAEKNDRTYAIMITACVKNGRPMEALDLWGQMEAEGIIADRFIVTSLIAACTRLQALDQGRAIHEHIVVTGFRTDSALETAFLQMYAKCGSLDDAKRVFEGMTRRDLFCWSAMISAYAKAGQGEMAVVLYRRMISEGVEPNEVVFASALAGCANVGALADGRAIHRRINTSKIEQDEVLQDALLNMYIKCGSVREARKVFDEMIARNARSYTAMMSAYIQKEDYSEVLKLYTKMVSPEEDLEPNAYTFATILGAAEGLEDLQRGRAIHKEVVEKEFEKEVPVQNALVTMYGKCGSLSEAREVFDNMEPGSRNVISWTSMIAAYAQHGNAHEALRLFKEMDVEPSAITFSSALGACALLGALDEGTEIHARAVDAGIRSILLETALMNMYAKCGSLDSARNVFNEMLWKDTFSCNTILAAYVQHGRRKQAIRIYRKMELEGIQADGTTFSSLLMGSGHAGRVADSREFFRTMVTDYGVVPSLEHYLCILDVLGRSGKLNDAEELVETMPFEAEAAVWMTLLGGCKRHGDIERAERVAEQIFKLAPQETLPYIVLSNMYVGAKRFDDASKIRERMQELGVKRSLGGSSFIEVDNELHRFVSGDSEANPKMEQTRSLLLSLLDSMKEAGYVPNTKEVLEEVSEEEKERILCFHSERLAIAYGLITDQDDEKPLRIVNNERVCSDCHVAIKHISDIVQRQIIVRDASRFHRFENGACSCGDYW